MSRRWVYNDALAAVRYSAPRVAKSLDRDSQALGRLSEKAQDEVIQPGPDLLAQSGLQLICTLDSYQQGVTAFWDTAWKYVDQR